MAIYYDKLSDITEVQSPREMAYRKFNMGDDWTEIRIGMFASAVASSGPNNLNTSEIYLTPNVVDYAFFGLHNLKTAYPGEAGSRSIGVTSVSSTIQSIPSNGIGDASGEWRATSYVDTTRTVNGTSSGTGQGNLGNANPTGATAYAAFAGIKFTVNNRGLSTQSVTIGMHFDNAGTAGNDYSSDALRILMNVNSFAVIGTLAWNDGTVAYDLPDMIALRSPMFNNSFRVSAWRVDRYAP